MAVGVFSSTIVAVALLALLVVGGSGAASTSREAAQRLVHVTELVASNTLSIVCFTTLWAVAAGLAIAYCLRYLSRRLFPLVFTGLVTPLFVNQVALNASWMLLLGASGPVSRATNRVLGEPGATLLYTRAAVVIVLAHAMTPLALLACYAAMQTVDNEALSAASACGASPSVVARRVYIPAIRPGILASVLLVALLTLGYYITPAMLGGQEGMTLAKLVEQVLNRLGDESGAAVLGLGLGLLVLPLSYSLSRSLSAYQGSSQ